MYSWWYHTLFSRRNPQTKPPEHRLSCNYLFRSRFSDTRENFGCRILSYSFFFLLISDWHLTFTLQNEQKKCFTKSVIAYKNMGVNMVGRQVSAFTTAFMFILASTRNYSELSKLLTLTIGNSSENPVFYLSSYFTFKLAWFCSYYK